MDLKEKVQAITEVMRTTKQDWVASEPENVDIAIYLHFWRGDELVATVQCPIDRDKGLQAARMGAAGFSADTLMMSFESYHSKLGQSPITGKSWAHQEMQYVFETDPEASAKGWVEECITTLAHERGGSYAMVSNGYGIEFGKVVWKEFQEFVVSSADDGNHAAGMMFEFMQSAMAEPTIEERFAEEAKKDPTMAIVNGLVSDPERRLFHMDMATFKAMTEQNCAVAAVFSAKSGSLREELLNSREFPGMSVTDHF